MEDLHDDERGLEEYHRARQPHYAQNTVARSLPCYANSEQDVIRQAFQTGNYTWMKELIPVEIAPDSINGLRKKRMEQNRTGDGRPAQTWSKMTSLWGGGYYQEFEYMPEPYETDDKMKEKQADIEKRIQCGHKEDWHMSSQSTRQKYEPMLITKEELDDPRTKKTADFYLRPDPSVGQATAAESTQFSAGDSCQSSFLTGAGQGLNNEGKMSRTGMQPIIRQKLQRKLSEDWDDATVVVSFTEQDMVQIAFLLSTVDSERGLMAYMSILSKNDECINSLGLRRVSQMWGVTRVFPKAAEDTDDEDGDGTWMFFLLCPQWVRMRATDSYYTSHPRAQGSQFRMSEAGSSVLYSLGASHNEPSFSK